MFFKRRRFHTLHDIRKILIYIPPIFVVFIAIISISITSIILENKQNNIIDLILQEEEFNKKELLLNFVEDARDNANVLFDDVEIELNHSIYEVSGFIKSLIYEKKVFTFEDIKPYILNLEKQRNIQFVFFNPYSYEVIHGQSVISYLATLTNSNIDNNYFKKYMLKSIYDLGNENLQYWIEKDKRNIRLSYFEEIEGFNWYFGAFSKVDDIKNLLRKSILSSLVKKSKAEHGHFWFYDYSNDLVYNYKNAGEVLRYKDLIKFDDEYESKVILDYYHDNKRDNHTLNDRVFNFPKYQFLASIKDPQISLPSEVQNKIAAIKDEYNNKFTTAAITTLFITIFLVAVTVTFSKYINIIFAHYNRRLEVKNRLLVQWKERYELAIIASNDGLWDIDFVENKIYFSNKWLNMFGYDKEDITTFAQWLELIHKDDREDVKKEFEKHVIGQSEHFVHEYRLKTKTNNYKWVLVRGKVFKDKEDNAQRMLMMSMDIEERKQLTKELEDVEMLVEYGRIVIFKWKNNANMDVVHVSKSISSYGYNHDDFEDDRIKYLDFVHKDDRARLRNKIKESIRQKENSFTEIHRVYDKSGHVKWIFNRSIFVKDHVGNITHLYGYINDITRMKLNEEELKSKIKEEVDKNTEKDRLLVHQSKLAAMGEMLGNIAHQWRQPLNNMNLLIHFVRDNYHNKDFTKEDLDDSIKNAKLQIDYMSQTIDDFRNFYKPTKSKEVFDLRKSIQKAAKIIATQFEVNNIRLNIDEPSAQIESYENEFQQVIVNILNNAKDAAVLKKDKTDFIPRVDINIQKLENSVKLEVTNNCGNASSEVIERMFEPYFTTKFETQGTGIGLYMVKTIVETNMGGTIVAQNTQDGLKFVIILPL